MTQAVAEMQQAIRRNADDLKEELDALARWESETAAKEEARKHRASAGEPDLPPIRGMPKPAASSKPKVDLVQTAKDEGNEYFRLCKFEEAVRSYTRGINMDPQASSMHVLYANRAMCYLKLQMYDLAEKDASMCIQMNRTYTKAWYRRALARKAMGQLKDARTDLETVLVLSPGDTDGTNELKIVTTMLQEREKAAASSAPTAGQPSKKKKLVIQEVDNEDDEPPAPTSSTKAADDARQQAEREERHRKDQEAARAAEASAVAERARKAREDEAKRQAQRRSDSRVEVLESDDDAPPSPPKPEPTAAKPRHADPAPRRVHTEISEASIAEPKSFTDFESTYNDIKKKKPELLGSYLTKIPTGRWRGVFGSSMTPEVLADIFAAAGKMPTDSARQVLLGTASLNRISEVIMFMDDEDIAAGKSAVSKALEGSSGPERSQLEKFLSSM